MSAKYSAHSHPLPRGILLCHLPILALLVVVQLLLDHVDHDVVRHEPTLVHDLLSLTAQVGLGGDLRAQHVAGSEMAAVVLLLDLRGLGALAYPPARL